MIGWNIDRAEWVLYGVHSHGRATQSSHRDVGRNREWIDKRINPLEGLYFTIRNTSSTACEVFVDGMMTGLAHPKSPFEEFVPKTAYASWMVYCPFSPYSDAIAPKPACVPLLPDPVRVQGVAQVKGILVEPSPHPPRNIDFPALADWVVGEKIIPGVRPGFYVEGSPSESDGWFVSLGFDGDEPEWSVEVVDSAMLDRRSRGSGVLISADERAESECAP